MKPSHLFTIIALSSGPAHAEMFSMTCYPDNSTPYKVTYNPAARQAAVIGGRTGFVRTYNVFDVTDKPSKHILYVAMKAPGQTRTLYLAFDYSGINADVSSIRVIDGSHDTTDKCASDNFQEAALPTQESRSVAHEYPKKLDRRLLVINRTQSDVIGVYASAVSSNEWGDNMIVSSRHDPIPSGGSVLADTDDGSGNCHYDLKAVVSTGEFYTSRNVDVCSISRWIVGD